MKAKKLIGRRLGAAVLQAILFATQVPCENSFAEPPWRADAGTTFQQWAFDTNDMGPMLPDDYENTFGEPLLRVGAGNEWLEIFPDMRYGAWKLGGEIDIVIPNQPESGPDSYKDIWVQLTWMGAGNDPFMWDRPIVGLETNPLYDRMEMTREDTPLGFWTSTLFKISVWPNPYEEMITLKGDIYVDKVVVDTRCVPEPATLALITSGAFLALRRRRKN